MIFIQKQVEATRPKEMVGNEFLLIMTKEVILKSMGNHGKGLIHEVMEIKIHLIILLPLLIKIIILITRESLIINSEIIVILINQMLRLSTFLIMEKSTTETKLLIIMLTITLRYPIMKVMMIIYLGQNHLV